MFCQSLSSILFYFFNAMVDFALHGKESEYKVNTCPRENSERCDGHVAGKSGLFRPRRLTLAPNWGLHNANYWWYDIPKLSDVGVGSWCWAPGWFWSSGGTAERGSYRVASQKNPFQIRGSSRYMSVWQRLLWWRALDQGDDVWTLAARGPI